MHPHEAAHLAGADGLASLLARDEFHGRHLGPSADETRAMLAAIGVASVGELVAQTVPDAIRIDAPLALPAPAPEHAALAELRDIASGNQCWRSFIGAGYHGTLVPEPIRRNVLENPGWYTAYTPYQAEIAQGRLEALLNFQQMTIDLTGLPVANASLLDEATAAAEAMTLIRRSVKGKPDAAFLVDAACHPQVIAVMVTRAKWAGLRVVVADIDAVLARSRGDAAGGATSGAAGEATSDATDDATGHGATGDAAASVRLADLFGAHLQNPDTFGRVRDLGPAIDAIHAVGGMVSVGCDPLACLLVKSPGAMGADVAIGSAQRFGVPMGYGGPHAAFMAVRQELVRSMPGRIIGVSRDASGRPALRMALQTREQHIRRDKATSNICTAQALLANMAGFYAIWHGPEGLARIALRANFMARLLAAALAQASARAEGEAGGPGGTSEPGAAGEGGATAGRARLRPLSESFFDTLSFEVDAATRDAIRARAESRRINLRYLELPGAMAVGGAQGASASDPAAAGAAATGTTGSRLAVSVAFDETTTLADVRDVLFALAGVPAGVPAAAGAADPVGVLAATQGVDPASIPQALRRADPVLAHPVFSRHRSETEFMRYLKRLENKDYSLVHGMIPLGSCTMKLNAAAEMAPVTWPEFADLHPMVPPGQAAGYARMIGQLGDWLAEITGFAKVSFQPNSGAQGEYAGLLAIRNYLASRGEAHRDVCLIPSSAHGTNPASAQMMGMRIVVVACDAQGNVDVGDLEAKIAQHAGRVAALMVTYPSTHGVFEHEIVEVCRLVHDAGGQVYMDGANLNAQSGLAKPGLIGADVCHLNLHKTFCIPHGGGGPGMGPIAVAAHLAPHLPDDPFAGMAAASGQAGAAGGPAEPGAARAAGAPGTAASGTAGRGAVSAAPFGSALILTISWMYIRMMGATGIRRATEMAILNANYVAARLAPYFPVLFTGDHGRVAHECILDLRHLKAEVGVTAEDVAKRLMDYGFHAPTLSFPVADTLMVEPTESEDRAEIDRFCDAMIAIHGEIERIRSGAWDRADNPLKNAPHTAEEIAGDWRHGYSREQAAYPLPAVRAAKFWPSVKRVDNAAGDRQLVCTCPPMEAYTDAVSQTE